MTEALAHLARTLLIGVWAGIKAGHAIPRERERIGRFADAYGRRRAREIEAIMRGER